MPRPFMSEEPQFYIGRRLSYANLPCTVRYFGPLPGTKGDWLGVEWDDPTRGKHDGSYDGKKIFQCLSESGTAASFLRPSKRSDQHMGFLEAMQKKYVSDSAKEGSASERAINISGKTVEEVGFDKVRQQLAALQELRIVILDRLCVAGFNNEQWDRDFTSWWRLASMKLKIAELDLSNNLIEKWADVVGICSALKCLRSLKLDGNTFWNIIDQPRDLDEWRNPFPKVEELSINKIGFVCRTIGKMNNNWPWEFLNLWASKFPSLTHLSMSSNSLSNIPTCLSIDSLTHLDLSSNGFTTIEHIRQLTYLRRLQDLRLRSNPLTSLSSPPNRPIIFATLIRLDLTSTLLPTFSSLNPIIQSFPVLASLLTNHTPLTAFPSASLYTIARLATLTELNFTRITPAERQNAELYYLNQITAQLAAANDPNEKTAVLEEHPRWKKLCDIYGEPETAKKQGPDNVDGGSLAARVTEFNFYISRQDLHKARAQAKAVDGHEDEEARDVDDEDVDSNNAHSPPGSSIVEGKKLLIPLTVDVYRLKGIAGRLFNLRPMSVRLVWETGERDPVGGVGEGEWSVSEDDSSDDEGEGGQGRSKREARMKAEDGTNWVPRETELVDGTRQVGFWIESSEARVRVELR